MMLKTKVKVGEISNLSDARYCAGMGVEMLGFLLDTNEAVDLSDVKEITDWIEGCEYVAEFKESSIEEIEEKLKGFSFDLIQVTDKTVANTLKKKGEKTILKLEINQLEENEADYILIDGSPENIPNTDKKILLGGDISTEQLNKILDSSVTGINLLGSKEIRPGYKDFDGLADILELLETE